MSGKMTDTEKNKLNVGDKVRIRFSRETLVEYLRDINDMTFEEFCYSRDHVIGCDGCEGVVLEICNDYAYVDIKAKETAGCFKYDDIEEVK